MHQSFMKYDFKLYLLEMPDGMRVPTTRNVCFAFDAKHPDPNQRWEWDDSDDHVFVFRLSADEAGKQRGRKFDRERKERERSRDYFTGCIAFGTKYCGKICADCPDCESCPKPKSRLHSGANCHNKCSNCPDYVCRTMGLTTTASDEDGKEEDVEIRGLPETSETPHDVVENREKEAILAAFLETLTPTERIIWDCDVANTAKPRTYTDAEVAALIGKKQRKDAYNARQKLYAKIRANADLRDFFTN